MYVFTNTITTLYDYYVKLVIYSDNGLTGSTTETNGGYIISISDPTEELDPFTGEYKPGSLSVEMINKDDVVSDSIFGGSIAEMEMRLWISYDTGTTWECLFFGTVEHQGLKRTDKDATETENRRYTFSARHSMLSLKDIEIDTDPYEPGGNVPTQGVVTPGVTVQSASTDVNGSPVTSSNPAFNYDDYKFISLDGVLEYIFSNVQFISGATAPTLAYDSTAMQHKGKSLTGAGVEYTFDELHLLFESPSVDTAETFFSYSAGKYGVYSMSNLLEVLRLMMDSLIMIPVTRLTESGGSFTLSVYFEPRFRAAADLTALTGSVDYTITRTMSVEEWLDGVQVITTGLPEKSYSTISYGGRTFELKNHFLTGPYFNVASYVFISTYILPDADTGLDTIKHDGPSAQMLYGIAGGAVNTINQFKHLNSQAAYFSDPATGGYYGVHSSAFSLLNQNLVPENRTGIYGAKGYEITAKTLATDNAGTKSIWDLRLLKKITIDGTTCMITSIKRSVMTNTVTIRAIEVN